MQQYRVNYSLLVGLVVGTLVCSVLVYGLWRFQVGRKSGWLISEAEKAREAGDLSEAVRYYSQYLTIRGDNQARINYAATCADLAEKEDVSPEEFYSCWRALENALRNHEVANAPEGKQLRRRLVKLYGSERVVRYQDALDHLGILLQEQPNDAELQVLRTTYLFRSGNVDEAVRNAFKLIGYDPQADTFDVKKATAPNEVEVYTNLAVILRSKQNKPELADRVMDQLVEVNPETAKAYLARGQYHVVTGDKEASRADIDKAYELDPENADVLLALAGRAAGDEDYDKAGEYLAEGKKLHDQDPRFYQVAARISIQQQDFNAALAQIDEGLKHVKGRKGRGLLLERADLQFQNRDTKGLKETAEEMVKASFPPEFVEWTEARSLLTEDKWFRASEALSRLRPKVSSMGDLPQQVDNLRGLCYEKLGQPDLAADMYTLVLQQDPQNPPALAGMQRVSAQRGLEVHKNDVNPFQDLIAEELKKPKDERNWSAIDEMLPKFAEERKWDETTKKIFQARLMLLREDFAAASKALAEANQLSKDNLEVHRLAIQAARLNPQAGPKQAMDLWTKVARRFEDGPALRTEKADILLALHQETQSKDELKAELASLATGIENWSVPQKIEIWGALAARFLNLGMMDEAREYFRLSAEHQPQELPLRIALFSLAHDSNDDAGMQEAQQKILEIVGDKSHSAWLYSEARRRLSLVRRGQLGPEALPEIRTLVNRALQQRREWHDLYVLNAELELISNNVASALENFDRAASFGRLTPNAVAAHIRLLSAFGRFADAAKQLERLPESLRHPLLGQLYPEILFRTNKVQDAIQQARSASEADPNSPEKHFWYSQLVARAAQGPNLSDEQRAKGLKLAIEEMRRAVELEPELPEAWFALITYHRMLNEMEQAAAALRDAQLALSGDNLQVFLARAYEALGRWFDAETMYVALYDAAPDDLGRTQQLAAFYLGDVYQRPDKLQKATPLINKILRAGADDKLPPNDGNLLWARRMGAKILAATGDYQNLLKAENLLASNAKDGVLSLESKLEMAEILAPRPDPVSRLKAIALLEGVSKAQPLNEQGEILLGRLYYLVGGTDSDGWRKYSRQMETKAIARFPNSVQARAEYADKLLQRDDKRSIAEAEKHINRIRQIAAGSPIAFELNVRLAKKSGRQQQAISEIVARLPKVDDPKALDNQQAQALNLFARYLTELGDIATAERIHRQLAERDPAHIPFLAAFLGLHRGVDQCFAKLDEIYTPQRIPALLEVGMSVVRQRRDQVGDKFDAELQRWLDAGLRENPGSIQLQVVQADLHDLRKEYQEAANVYRKLLGRKDLTGMGRAVVLNNLAYLVALAGPEAGSDMDPLELVSEAAQVMGPNAEILDTRAVVYLARGEHKRALDDLKLAVTDNPTASKYFHKAQAHMLARDTRGAIEAWERAESLGLNRDALNRMEIEAYEKLKGQIDQLRNAPVTRADPLRKAG